MVLWTMQPIEIYQKIMKDGLYRCDFSLSGMEDCRIYYDWLVERQYDGLDQIEKAVFKSKNWEGVFETEKFKNDWCTRGENIQATFWKLRKEQIKKVRYFTSA